MTPCGIKWCVALSEKQFCILHEKDQMLHPREIDPEDELSTATDEAYEEGYADAKSRFEDADVD